MKNVIYTIITGSLLAALLVLVFIYGGYYNVAASEPHEDIVRWMLHTTTERSIAVRADDVQVPPDLTDSTRIRDGASGYAEMCEVCHGGPGLSTSVIAQGLRPEPPDLSEEAEHLSPGETFWIVKHGIKFTGMPAFGPTHSDGTLWNLTAFVQALPSISGAEYEQMTATAEDSHRHAESDSSAAEGHSHAADPEAHSHESEAPADTTRNPSSASPTDTMSI